MRLGIPAWSERAHLYVTPCPGSLCGRHPLRCLPLREIGSGVFRCLWRPELSLCRQEPESFSLFAQAPQGGEETRLGACSLGGVGRP